MKIFLTTLALVTLRVAAASAQVEMFPSNNAVDVNPDTKLELTFSSAPTLNNRGKIRVYDAANDSVVDELDMSIPPGPRNTRTPPPYDTFKYSSIPDTVFTVDNPDTDPSHVYQKNYIGDTNESSARHFFPVLLDGKTATIALHNNRLAYGKRYYVEVDAEVFGSTGIAGKTAWTFDTKKAPPAADANPIVVSADGSGDFSTVQGAIDWVPADNPGFKEIYLANGIYEEIVVLRGKQNLTIRGQDREQVIVRYANNGVFNSVGRYEFTVAGSSAINLVNFTIQSVGKDETPAQAEALYVKGDKYQVHHVTMLGSGDALQIQTDTRIFLSRSRIRGYGDNLLSYGASFFKTCDLISFYGPHGWPRNPQTNHGNVFVNSTFSLEGEGTSGDGHCTLARSPTSGVSFPYAEFVLINCKLQGIAPEGWGAAGPDTSNVHFWEYNSVNLSDGMPVDVSRRVSYSRQLTMETDAETIANYSDPSYVLAGWTPELAPIILRQLPASLEIPAGGAAEISTEAAAEPEPTYQWFKDGQVLSGETSATLKLEAATTAVAGEYSLSIGNRVGMVTSSKVLVVVGGQGAPPSAGTVARAGTGGMASVPSVGGAGAAPQAGRMDEEAPAGAAAPAGVNASPISAGGTTMPVGAAGTVDAIAGAAASGGAQEVSQSGGCSVGWASRAGSAWSSLLFACVIMRKRRRRSAR